MAENNQPPEPGLLRKFCAFLGRLFRFLLGTYCQLKPCGFGIAMAVLAYLVFVQADQGAEVLRALAEQRTNEQGEYFTGATGIVRLLAFGSGALLWCLASWYTARTLLYVNLPASQRLYVQVDDNWPAAHRWLARNVPRILGAAPMAIIGYSMLSALTTYEVDPPKWLWIFGGIAFLGSFGLWFLLHRRRKLLVKRAREGVTAEPSSSVMLQTPGGEAAVDLRVAAFNKELLQQVPKTELESLESREVLPVSAFKSSHRILLWSGIASVILLGLFTFYPIDVAGAIGTGAVLTLAGATWVLWGSALVYWGTRARIPILTLVLLWAVFCSIWNDNHNIRVSSENAACSRPELEQALSDWHANIAQHYSDQPKHPLFIVTAEGGGIRAAYWTAAVLGTIQDRDPRFADHVFAISGVSGGSVGAAVFAALLAQDAPQGEYARRAEEMLGQDFLSPAIAAMLYPDFAQRFWPWPIQFLDRGHWMEESWERAWRDTASKHGQQNDQLAQPFCALWSEKTKRVPALFLNATSVEHGNRVIVSNILIHRKDKEQFLNADDVIKKIGKAKDIRLSTAAHLSARFTYVSPAARFPADNTHAVDGGYFENSGATTATDILRQITLLQNDPDPAKRAIVADVVPKIIMISNNPMGTAFWEQQCQDNPKDQKKEDRTIKRDLKHRKPSSFLEDALAPVYALLQSRDARGVYAQREIGYRPNGSTPDLEKKVYFFSLAKTTVPLPLGWMLSNRAAEAIQLELNDEKATANGTRERIRECHTGPELTWNSEARNLIIDALNGKF